MYGRYLKQHQTFISKYNFSQQWLWGPLTKSSSFPSITGGSPFGFSASFSASFSAGGFSAFFFSSSSAAFSAAFAASVTNSPPQLTQTELTSSLFIYSSTMIGTEIHNLTQVNMKSSVFLLIHQTLNLSSFLPPPPPFQPPLRLL